MDSTIIGVFDERSDADQACNLLRESAIDNSRVRIVSPDDMRDGRTRSDYQGDDQSMGEQISSFFSSLFDGDDAKGELGPRYLEAVRRGSTLVIVDADSESDVVLAERILSDHRSVDIDQRGSSWSEKGWSSYDENAPLYTDEEVQAERQQMGADQAQSATLTEQQEELRVGSRRTDAGKVKVFQRVVEDNVEETVGLEEQHATIRRRSVDRPVSAADASAFEEGVVEVEQYVDEAVVDKKTRVTGEVDVGVDRKTREKTVSDTVRRTEVEVEGDVEVSDKH